MGRQYADLGVHRKVFGAGPADIPARAVLFAASELEVYYGRTEIAGHERLLAEDGSRSLFGGAALRRPEHFPGDGAGACLAAATAHGP